MVGEILESDRFGLKKSFQWLELTPGCSNSMQIRNLTHENSQLPEQKVLHFYARCDLFGVAGDSSSV